MNKTQEEGLFPIILSYTMNLNYTNSFVLSFVNISNINIHMLIDQLIYCCLYIALMEKLIDAISEKVQLNSDLKLLITESFKTKEIRKNDQILREDQTSNKLYFLESGVIRSFSLS